MCLRFLYTCSVFTGRTSCTCESWVILCNQNKDFRTLNNIKSYFGKPKQQQQLTFNVQITTAISVQASRHLYLYFLHSLFCAHGQKQPNAFINAKVLKFTLSILLIWKMQVSVWTLSRSVCIIFCVGEIRFARFCTCYPSISQILSVHGHITKIWRWHIHMNIKIWERLTSANSWVNTVSQWQTMYLATAEGGCLICQQPSHHFKKLSINLHYGFLSSCLTLLSFTSSK